MDVLKRLLRALPLLLVSPVLLIVCVTAIALADLFWLLAGAKRRPVNRQPKTQSATVVIPNWNGRDLLAKYLPPLVEAVKGNAANEILVVDNGSHDGSAEYVGSTSMPQRCANNAACMPHS